MVSTVSYHHKKTERQAQQRWAAADCFAIRKDDALPKFFCLSLPLNLAGKLYLGQCRNHVICDVMARCKRMQGHNVLHAVGWDTFGLQVHLAAQAAGENSAQWVTGQVAQARDVLMRLGLSADWSHQVSTSDPSHYKWQQELFLRLWHQADLVNPERQKGVAYWDPATQSHLSLRQMVNGRGPDSGMLVEVREVETYEVKVSQDLANELLVGLSQLPNWDCFVKNMQRESIGCEEGLALTFPVHDKDGNKWPPLQVFTSRPDTIMGTTFLAVGTEHELARRTAEASPQVAAFCAQVNAPTYAHLKMAEDKKQEGMPLGLYAVNPTNGDHIPVWVANFVVAGYGTNAVLGVPGHDQRNFNFAQRHNLPLRRIATDADNNLAEPLLKPLTDKKTKLINSGKLERPLNNCKEKLLAELLTRDKGKDTDNVEDSMAWRKHWDSKVNSCVLAFLRDHGMQATPSKVTRLRNWKITSQDYWGCPVPLVHCPDCGVVPVPAGDLPITLPEQATGKDALADYPDFRACACPVCGKNSQRDCDTLSNLLDIAFLPTRLTCPDADHGILDDRASTWLPVDFYCCGVENATNHLLCTRLLHRLMHKTKVLPESASEEPISHLLSQGMVFNYGLPMDAIYANAIEPDQLLEEYGADLLRLYLGASIDPRHPLHWDDRKLFALQGILDDKGLAALRSRKLAGAVLDRVHHLLAPSEIRRLQEGLLNQGELAQLRHGTLAGAKLAAVEKLLAPSESKRLQQGLLDQAELHLLCKGKLPANRMAQVRKVLTDVELERLRHGILSAHELTLLNTGHLPAKVAAQVEANLPTAAIAKVKQMAIDPNHPGSVCRLQAECLDELEQMAAEERNLLMVARQVLTDGDLNRLWHGLLNADEYAALRAGQLNDSKLAAVRELCSKSELHQLQHGILERNEMVQFRRGSLPRKKCAQLRKLLGTDTALARWQTAGIDATKLALAKQSLPDRRRLRQLRAGKLGRGKASAMAQILTKKELDAYQASIMEASLFTRIAGFIEPDRHDQLVNFLDQERQEELDRIMDASDQQRLRGLVARSAARRPLLRFLDSQRMDALLNHLDHGRMDRLVNFISRKKMEQLLGYTGYLWHLVNQRQAMASKGRGQHCTDERRIQLHDCLQAINVLYGVQEQDPAEQSLQLNRVVNRSRDLFKLLDEASDPNSDNDCALVAETLEILLKILHPLVPHITEELWQLLALPGLLATASWPVADTDVIAQRDQIVLVVQENGRHRLSLATTAAAKREALLERATTELLALSRQHGYPTFPKTGEAVKHVEWAQRQGECVVNFVTGKSL